LQAQWRYEPASSKGGHGGGDVRVELNHRLRRANADGEERDYTVRARLAADLTGIAINEHASTVARRCDTPMSGW